MIPLPDLETDRMYLRPLCMQDVPQVYQMDRNPKVMRYIGKARAPKTHSAVVDWVKRRMAKGDGLGTWSAFLKKDRTFVGCFLLIQLENSRHVEIGYRLREEYWGLGLATEGAQRVLTYAFHHLALENVVGIAYPEHVLSRKVLEKLGLQYLKKDRYYDVEVVYYEIDRASFYRQSSESTD